MCPGSLTPLRSETLNVPIAKSGKLRHGVAGELGGGGGGEWAQLGGLSPRGDPWGLLISGAQAPAQIRAESGEHGRRAGPPRGPPTSRRSPGGGAGVLVLRGGGVDSPSPSPVALGRAICSGPPPPPSQAGSGIPQPEGWARESRPHPRAGVPPAPCRDPTLRPRGCVWPNGSRWQGGLPLQAVRHPTPAASPPPAGRDRPLPAEGAWGAPGEPGRGGAHRGASAEQPPPHQRAQQISMHPGVSRPGSCVGLPVPQFPLL